MKPSSKGLGVNKVQSISLKTTHNIVQVHITSIWYTGVLVGPSYIHVRAKSNKVTKVQFKSNYLTVQPLCRAYFANNLTSNPKVSLKIILNFISKTQHAELGKNYSRIKQSINQSINQSSKQAINQ
jgi:hypothetical protein